jgi:hypothetical protein
VSENESDNYALVELIPFSRGLQVAFAGRYWKPRFRVGISARRTVALTSLEVPAHVRRKLGGMRDDCGWLDDITG